MRPTLKLMMSHPAHFISLGFGSGLSPWAPGTAGTLLGWALYPLLSAPLSEFVFLAFLASLFIVGVLAAERTGRTLGVPDHGGIVWDEMVAIWLVLAFTPATLGWQAVAVALFRFFDIVKPPPVRWADRSFKGGFGVMFDDIIAAGYTLLVLAILVQLFGR
ncbi:phosphatidylglycerophosphatase A family protein [Thauera butanivorans]|uniref:phosphatidylglycerophosphatase A family protein n=1 Tax=Thauera butanivorans TaxID=86174 RepID=UPI000838D69B|nr:phosphatidylglycerophosphatase A [Thauera butanivorans]